MSERTFRRLLFGVALLLNVGATAFRITNGDFALAIPNFTMTALLVVLLAHS